MLLLSFLLAAVATWLGSDFDTSYIRPFPATIAALSGWDLIRRWQFNQRIHDAMVETMGGAEVEEEWMTEKDQARARWRLFATPLYFVLALIALIVELY